MNINKFKDIIHECIAEVIDECNNPLCERVCVRCKNRFNGTMICPKCGKDNSSLNEIGFSSSDEPSDPIENPEDGPDPHQYDIDSTTENGIERQIRGLQKIMNTMMDRLHNGTPEQNKQLKITLDTIGKAIEAGWQKWGSISEASRMEPYDAERNIFQPSPRERTSLSKMNSNVWYSTRVNSPYGGEPWAIRSKTSNNLYLDKYGKWNKIQSAELFSSQSEADKFAGLKMNRGIKEAEEKGIGPFIAYVKRGRRSGQTILVNKRKNGVYYFFNMDTGKDEPVGTENDLDIQQNSPKLNEVETKVDKISTREKDKISLAFTKVGLDGNGRFDKKELGLRAVSNVLHEHGFSLDMVTADLIMGEKGSRNFRFRRVNDPGQDIFTEKPEIKNSMVIFTWENLSSAGKPIRFEILAYLS